MPDAVLIAQGDELTTGQTVDSNSAWMADRLWALGVRVRRVMTAPDDLPDLIDIIAQASGLAPIVVCTGGLGPTRDDLTAEAVAAVTGRPLRLDPVALGQVEAMYARYSRRMPEVNRKQALLPEGAQLLENRWGTAPGFRVAHGGARLSFLPGVPREMRPMFELHVEPDVRAHHDLPRSTLRTLKVVGLGESALEERLAGLDVPGMRVGFRTLLPENHVKLVFSPDVPAEVQAAAVAEARARIGPAVFGVDCGELPEVLAQALLQAGHTVALAESCTAGAVAAALGRVPGVSAALLEGAVLYSNEAKVRLGVPEGLIAAHGAVSEPVARALAEAARRRAGATWGVGITGIAGPGGGSPEKPVGTVHIAVAGPDGTAHQAQRLPGDRHRVQAQAAASAMALLLAHLPA